MCEIIDKIALKAVKPECFLVVNEDDEDAHENDSNKKGKNQDHHPGLSGEDLIRIQMGLLREVCKPCSHLHIPVDIQGEGQGHGRNGGDENKDRMKKPS